MNKQWRRLIGEEKLHCHICKLLIYKTEHLTGDHDPIPKSRGGIEKQPAHYWCNEAKAYFSQLYSARLERLLKKWSRHGIPYPPQAEDSLMVMRLREQNMFFESMLAHNRLHNIY